MSIRKRIANSLENVETEISAIEEEVEEVVGVEENTDRYSSPRSSEQANPFNEELGAQKESDSNQMQNSYHDTGSGWIPFHASDKRPIRLSLWDNTQVPGYQDRSEAWGGNENAMGNAPFRNYENAPDFEKLTRPSQKTMEDQTHVNPMTEIMNALDKLKDKEDEELLLDSSLKKRILKISSNDDSWMPVAYEQVSQAGPEFANKLGETYGGAWKVLRPIKDGNTLRFHWSSGNGINIKKFLLYLRYNAGSDTYSASSSVYDGETNQEKTLVSWTDDIYVDQIMDPSIWITGE